MKVIDLQARREVLDAWTRDLSEELTAVQAAAVHAGVLEPTRNLLVVAPTSSGKTLVGEMAAASVAAQNDGRYSILAVPTKALAEEHFNRFRERYSGILNVVISTGDWIEFDLDVRLGHFDLAVMTYEKLAILLAQAAGVLDRCGCVIVDEGQSVNDADRGAGLELLITQLLIHPAKPRLVVLSASLDDLNGFDRWLGATTVAVTERPVPLDQAVCAIDTGLALLRTHEGQVETRQFATPVADPEAMTTLLALRCIAEGKQVLIFRMSIAGTRRLASELATRRPSVTIPQEWADRLASLEDADSARALAPLFSAKVAPHNADLGYSERRLIEDAFRARYLDAIVATETLAMGVNLPADVVIIVETDRYSWNQGWRTTPVRVADYRNMAGRAGRLGLGARGLTVVIAKNLIVARQLFNHYIAGPVEPMKSTLPSHRMTDIAFRLLAAGTVRDVEALRNFLTATYAYPTFYERHGGASSIGQSATVSVAEAVATGLLATHDGHVHPTAVARVLARSGVALDTAIRLKGLVDRLITADVSVVELLFEICRCEESGIRPYVPRKGEDPRPGLHESLTQCSDSVDVARAMRASAVGDETLQALIQTSCAIEWIEGVPTRALVKRYLGLSGERLRNMGASLAWLLESLAAAAKSGGVDEERMLGVARLAQAARYGLPNQLAGLAKLHAGLRRETLLALGQKGITDPNEVLELSADTVSDVLSPIELAKLQQAIRNDTVETLRRRRSGHVHRAARAGLDPRLMDALYSAHGDRLECVVRDALEAAGLPTMRLETQAYGEEDLHISTVAGLVVGSVTASEMAEKPVPWRKAREVMGQGAGLNPVNFVCIGRPRFDGLAERSARAVAREEQDRRLLLIPLDVLAEAIMRIAEGKLDSGALGSVLAAKRGILSADDLDMQGS